MRPARCGHGGPPACQEGALGYRGAGMRMADAEQIMREPRGYDRLLGVQLLALSDSEARAQIAVRDELRQGMGLVHGGVYASIAESITSIATALAVGERGEQAVGLSNNTSFLRPITEGVIQAHASCVHRGRTTWVWDVRFSDDADRTCALTRMTIAVRPRRA